LASPQNDGVIFQTHSFLRRSGPRYDLPVSKKFLERGNFVLSAVSKDSLPIIPGINFSLYDLTIA
jgi:hypothetical protein